MATKKRRGTKRTPKRTPTRTPTRPRDGFAYPSNIPYTPDTWTAAQVLAHRASTLDGAFNKASCLAGGWYGRAITIDWQVTPDNNERYMLRPSEVAALDGWQPCYEVKAVRS